MIADNCAAAQRGKTDGAGLTRAGDAIAATLRMAVEINAAPRSSRLTQQQSCARRGIHFHAMVHFDNFNIEILAQCCGHPFDQCPEQINPQTHIAGAHNHRMTRRRA